ncbi:MAG: hypothetical protein JWO06_3751, partial [Bacteroidota bacterium]|nr:hypothetical protein [Bacteroidota bacterium]
ITDTSGCTFVSDTATVKIDSFNVISVLPLDTNICNGSGLSLNAGGYQVVSYQWSPGGSTSATPIISAPAMYYVTATDIHGCVAHDSTNVTTHGAAPTADFTITNFCSNDTIKFADQSQAGAGDVINSWTWNFGDTATGAGVNAQHFYTAPGQYPVTLFITTNDGCTGAKTMTAPVYGAPEALFTFVGSNPLIPYAICAGNFTIFTDVTNTADSLRSWIIDGITNSATQPQFQYRLPNSGANYVTLKVTNTQGCASSITQEVDVFPALAANFSYTGACYGDNTEFTDLTHSFSIIGWQWDFGDSIIGLLKNESHHYATPGNYNVTLTVENAIGCIDHQTQFVNIVPQPVANFTGTTGCKDQAYTPLDASIVAPSDPIAYWKWTIDGSIDNHQTPQHTFADTGSYHVSLAITTQSGCKDSVSKTVEIEPVPLAAFTFTPLYGSAPIDVTFTNNSSGATTYSWNFGDGTFSTDDAPIHTYTQNSTYEIILYAQNTFGCTDSSAKTFVVVPTDLDLSVDAVSTISETQPDGSILVSAIVRCSNLGTRIITSAKFYAVLGSGAIFESTWTGILQSGQIMIDTLKADFVVASGDPNTYICVDARDVNDGETEIRYDNNRACTSLDGNLQIVGPSPNPAFQQSSLGLILPKAGKVTIDIVDLLGHYVIHQYVLELPVGRSDFAIPIDLMAVSEYHIRVSYNDNIQVRKLVVR